MAEAVIGVVTKVAEWLFDPIRRQICYVCKYESNIKELKKQEEKLDGRRKRVQIDVEQARVRGDEIYEDVQTWLDRVGEFTQEAADVISKLDDVGADETEEHCFKRLDSRLNLKMRYSRGKKAVKMVGDCGTLFNDGDFQTVSYRIRPQRSESMYVQGYQAFDSRESIFNDIMGELRGNKVDIIGVHGMGGVGKTTLVRKVVAQATQVGSFDEVVFVEVTEKPEIKTIQKEIAEQLGLVFEEETVEARACVLRARLKKAKRVLIVLDNLWGELNLDRVGISLGKVERASFPQIEAQQNVSRDKILLTCRDLQVCNVMKTKKNFSVVPLSSEEAMGLFWKLLDDSAQELELESVATKIVGKCAGLPIAIAAIAKSLKTKSKSYWDDALNQLEASNIEDIYDGVYSVIRLSYDLLKKKEARSLFLLCGLEGVGRFIYVDDLTIYGMGLGLFKNINTLTEGRKRVDALIEDLKAASLLLDGEKYRVKMHDITHVVAKAIAAENRMFNMENVANLRDELEKEKYNNSVAISLPYGNTRELPKRLGCQGLDIFLFWSENEHIPNAFFEGLGKLKVLDLTEFSLPSLPLSLGNLANLHTLCLDWCHLGDITMIGKLKTLKMLTFRGSDIESVPQQIGQLTQLKLLDLSRCSKLKVIMPNVLSSLSELEELYIDDSFVQWELEGQDNASLAELKVLSHLTALHLHVNDAETMPEDLIFENLERYNILIGDVWDSCAVSRTSRMLKVKLNNMSYLGDGVCKLLRGAEYLHLDELNGFRNVYPELSYGEDFPNLRHLVMQNDHCISYIIYEEWGAYDAFPILESLLLCNMINLKKIRNEPRVEHFNNLKVIKVEYCDSLKYLFSLPEAKILSQLQELEVKNCKDFKEIVCEESEENSHITVVEFRQLQSLTLKCLQNFAGCGFTTNMSSEEINPADKNLDFMTLFSKKVAFPSLKYLNLSSLNIKSIWLDQIPTMSFGETLTSLVVERCNSLKYLFSFSMVGRLAQLQRLQICNCELIEMIIDTEELVGKNKRIETRFPELRHLKLEGLPKLTSFGNGSIIEFASLDDLQIKNCSSLNTFSSGSTYVDAHPLLDDEKVLLPNMASLSISSINCDNIWVKQLPVASSCNRYLTTISVDGCANLKYLFSSSMAKSLDQLKKLYIRNCTIMEEIIVTTEEEKMSKMLFPSLIRMELKNLPKLARFCSFTGISIELPLTDLWITRCPSMQTFISNSTCVEVKVSMELEEANSEENISPLFDDKVGLPNLKHLIILEMDNLRRIWHNRQALHRSSNLHGLAIGYCKRLVNVFPYQMVGRLGKLEVLYVYDCDSLEYIIEKHETMTEENIFCEEEVIKEIPKFVFPRLAEVQLRELPMLKNFYPGVHILGWRVLTLLDVFGCCNKGKTYCAEYLSLQESNGKSYKEIPNDQLPLFLVDSKAAFQRLEEWAVELNDSMPQICDGIYGIQLSKLKVLRITCSPNAATLPTCVIPVLPNLDKLFIEGAHFKEIFLFEEQQGCEGESARTPIRLSELTLAALPSLLHLCRENSRPSQVFQGLTTLRVLKCSSLKVLIPPLVCFQNLTTLEVSNCHGLINLGTLPTAKSLTQLTRMSITECEGIEEIIMCVGDEEKEEIFFSKLEFLELRGLLSLASFCSGNHSFKFPSLKQIIVRQCPNLKVFCWGILSTPKLRKLQLTEKEDEEGCWEGDLNTTLRHLFQGMVGFRGLEKVELSKFPHLKEIWDGQISVCFFSNLRSLVVEKCMNITSAISVRLLPFLNNLTFLRVEDCDSVEEIFHLDKLNHDGHTGLLSQLTSLDLVELPRLRNILNISHLEIHAFESLKMLSIHKCSNLRYIVTTTIIQGLVQLQELRIRDCVMVEEIIAEDRRKDAAKDCITVPQLNSIFWNFCLT